MKIPTLVPTATYKKIRSVTMRRKNNQFRIICAHYVLTSDQSNRDFITVCNYEHCANAFLHVICVLVAYKKFYYFQSTVIEIKILIN